MRCHFGIKYQLENQLSIQTLLTHEIQYNSRRNKKGEKKFKQELIVF